jgi:hypothetical protein
LHHNAPPHASFFTREFLANTRWLSSPTHPACLFPRLNMKLKSHHVDKFEVMEAELQAVLNSLTEHDFQDAFTK